MAKILNRVLGLAGVAILASSLGALAACGEPADENAAAKETVSNANVALTLYDDNGIAVGEGSGILIAPKTVLTSAHLVAGKGKWTVTSADGKTKVNGVRGQTFDWRKYDSNLAHPRKHDVAVIFLDRPIQLASYPKIATAAMPAGEQVMRVRHDKGGFQMIDSDLAFVRQMPNAYVTSMPGSESLDTGGAVVNKKGEIVGVVTGRGMQTGKLYIAKLGEVVGWLSNKATCGGAASGSALAIRTIGTPPPKDGCTKDGGTSSSSSGGSSSGGSSSGASGSSSGGSSSGASGSSSGGGGASSSGDNGSNPNDSSTGKCEVGGGYEYPGGGGSPGVSEATGVNGSSQNGSTGPGSGTGGGTGSGSGTGTGTGGGDGTGTNGGTENGATNGGTNTGGTGSGTGTGTGTGGGTNTGTNGGTENGSTSTGTGTGGGAGSGSNTGSNTGVIPGGSGGAGSSTLEEEVCEGENDNPDVCPPESVNCEGPTCGGAFKAADNTIDYGACSCMSVNTEGSGSIILR